MNDEIIKKLTGMQNSLNYSINHPMATMELTNNLLEDVRQKQAEEQQYKENVLNALRQIEINTANLSEIISLLHTSNENQSKIFDVVVEMLSIAKEKDKEVAQLKFRKIMDKIGKVTTDVEALTKLYGLGTTLYSVLQAKGIL